MKYSKFKKEVEKLGFGIFSVDDRSFDYILINFSDRTIASVSKLRANEARVGHDRLKTIDKELKKEVFMLCFELANTPLNEREDEKRYRLKLPFAMESGGYLNTYSDRFFVSSKTNVIDYRTIFTETEIEELKRKHNLDSFVLEEVLEDE